MRQNWTCFQREADTVVEVISDDDNDDYDELGSTTYKKTSETPLEDLSLVPDALRPTCLDKDTFWTTPEKLKGMLQRN